MKRIAIFVFFNLLLAGATIAQSNTSVRMDSGKRFDKGQKITANYGWYLYMQADGNLVFYNKANEPKWATMTHGKTVTHCIMQPDGNLVIYNGTAAVWSSNTANMAPGGYFKVEAKTLLGTFSIIAGIYKADGTLVKKL